jgi:hypothetical protein
LLVFIRQKELDKQRVRISKKAIRGLDRIEFAGRLVENLAGRFDREDMV